MTTVQPKQDVKLTAHLLRRAGFGATPDELDRAMQMGYEATLEELLNPHKPDTLPDDLIRRYHVDQSDLRGAGAASAHWIYRLVKTESPLREKMCLFWHRIFGHRIDQAHPSPRRNISDRHVPGAWHGQVR